MHSINQPLQFEPLYEGERGRLLAEYLTDTAVPDRAVDSTILWQLVDSPDLQSTVSNGRFQGRSLRSLVEQDPEGLVGRGHRAVSPFPVCMRLRETTVNEPISVHPQAEVAYGGKCYARNQRFWFSLAADPHAEITVGIGISATRQSILSRANQPAVGDMLRTFHPGAGDAFFVPSGCPHALGTGNLVWELAEHCGSPLRLSGWGQGDDMHPEEIEAAASAVFFQDRQLRRIAREARPPRHTWRAPLLTLCPQFAVDQIHICDRFIDRTDGTTFHALAVTGGEVRFETDGFQTDLHPGSLVLVPASGGEYRLYADTNVGTVLRVILRR